MNKTIEKTERAIKKQSRKSLIAPPEFLEAELRRWCTRYALFYGMDSLQKFSGQDFERVVETLESDYQCYFETAKFMETVQPNSWWKFTYAGCNAQIEGFLLDNGFAEVAEHLWEGGISAGIKRWEEEDFFKPKQNSPNDRLLRYLIGIGYLYPQEEGRVKVHPNLLFAQLGTRTTFHTTDSSFLTRDLIRCPYYEANGQRWQESISDQELWNYWRDLVTLSVGDLPEYRLYLREDFQGKRKLQPEVQRAFALGRRIVPRRYVALEPVVERFEWIFPEGK